MRPWFVCIICVSVHLSTASRPASGWWSRSRWKRCRHTHSCNRSSRKRLYPEQIARWKGKLEFCRVFLRGRQHASDGSPSSLRRQSGRCLSAPPYVTPPRRQPQRQTCSSTSLKAAGSSPDPCGSVALDSSFQAKRLTGRSTERRRPNKQPLCHHEPVGSVYSSPSSNSSACSCRL
jgi:hypothetical protein